MVASIPREQVQSSTRWRWSQSISTSSKSTAASTTRPKLTQLGRGWNAPPTIPTIRKLRTLVYLDFAPADGNRTSLTLRNFGYGDGEEWAQNKAYFQSAWPAVMASLEKRFAKR